MKKTLCFMLAFCMLVLCNCGTAETPDTVKKSDVAETTQETPDTVTDEKPENERPAENTEQAPAQTEKQVSLESVMREVGAVEGEGASYFADAEIFSKCLQNRKNDTIANYTGGSEEYYGFLNDVEIASFSILPIEFPQELIQQKAQNGLYLMGEDFYLVEYDVAKADGQYFKEGKNIYLMIFGSDPVAEGSLRAFVPYEKAQENIFYDVNNYSEYDSYFVKEFASLYGNYLSDGKNYPASFDFNNQVHLITHLMARCGRYNENPPFTLDEIEEFITESFDGNKGLTFNEYRDYERWSAGHHFAEEDILKKGARCFGCSYAHGGTTVQHSIVSSEWEGKYTKTVTARLYADYSNFAIAKELVFTFEITQDSLPKLVLVMQNGNTGFEPAVISI